MIHQYNDDVAIITIINIIINNTTIHITTTTAITIHKTTTINPIYHCNEHNLELPLQLFQSTNIPITITIIFTKPAIRQTKRKTENPRRHIQSGPQIRWQYLLIVSAGNARPLPVIEAGRGKVPGEEVGKKR